MPLLVSSSLDVDVTTSLRYFTGFESLRELWSLAYRCLHGIAPGYLSIIFQCVFDVTSLRHLYMYVPVRRLSRSLLVPSAAQHSVTEHSQFPRTWNNCDIITCQL